MNIVRTTKEWGVFYNKRFNLFFAERVKAVPDHFALETLLIHPVDDKEYAEFLAELYMSGQLSAEHNIDYTDKLTMARYQYQMYSSDAVKSAVSKKVRCMLEHKVSGSEMFSYEDIKNTLELFIKVENVVSASKYGVYKESNSEHFINDLNYVLSTATGHNVEVIDVLLTWYSLQNLRSSSTCLEDAADRIYSKLFDWIFFDMTNIDRMWDFASATRNKNTAIEIKNVGDSDYESVSTIYKFVDKYGKELIEKTLEKRALEKQKLIEDIKDYEDTIEESVAKTTEEKETIAEAIERLTDGVEVILDEEVPDEELPKQDATENIEALAEDVKEASEEELAEKYDLTHEEAKELKRELAEIKEEVSEVEEEESNVEEAAEDKEMSTVGLSEQELIIHNTPVEELTSADVRRVALAHARNKTLFKTAAMFAISEEKCQAILDRFYKKFASEEERDQKVLEMREAGASNAQIKEECCIISDPVLYSIYKKYGVPKKPRSRKEVDLTDPTSELVIDTYNSGITIVYQIRKTTGVSEYLIKKILSAANDAGLIHLPESPEDVE